MRTLLTGEGGGEAAGSPLTQGKDAYELEVSSAAAMPKGQRWWAQVPVDPREHATAIHPSTHRVRLAAQQFASWGAIGPGAFGVLIFRPHHVEPDTCSSFSCPCLSPGIQST